MNAHASALLKEIAQLTQHIQARYPDLYRNLSEEKPAFDPDNAGGLTVGDLQTYLDFLQNRMESVSSSKSAPHP